MTTSRTLVIEKELSHSPAKIWRALSESNLISEWLMDNDFQPKAGHHFKFRATPVPQWDGLIVSEVLAVEPCTKLSYRWNSMGVETIVLWTLVQTESGTLLRMEQSGFGPDQDANYKGANCGWQKFIGALEGVVAGLE